MAAQKQLHAALEANTHAERYAPRFELRNLALVMDKTPSVFSTLFGRVPLTHPRRRSRDQHAVVRVYNGQYGCTLYGAYAVRAGVEPSNAALALPDRHFPAGGLCSSLACANYQLVLFQ